MTTYRVYAVTGLGEITPGSDLAGALVAAGEAAPIGGLRNGDVLVVTSKVVSKAEGALSTGERENAVVAETDRIVAQRGPTSIVRTRHGFVMAAAGVDASNTAPGTLVLLPRDPDASARRLREAVAALSGRNVGVVVSDTMGRAWRQGQTDTCVGAAGLIPLDDHTGRTDAYGNELAVTAPALADELAAAGDLAKGKLGGLPVAVVRGLGHLVLPAGDHGPGAGPLVRDEETDMFGLGAREAVVAALVPGSAYDARRGFGVACPVDTLAAVLTDVLAGRGSVEAGATAIEVRLRGPDERTAGALALAVTALCTAHGWAAEVSGDLVRCRPGAGPPGG